MMTRSATVADGVRLMAQMPPERRAGFRVQGFADHLARSRMTWAGVAPDGAVVAVGGVMDSGRPGIGYLWQVIDPAAVARNRRGYLRQSRAMQAAAHQLYPHLSVCIEPDNGLALRHARRMGWRPAGSIDLPQRQAMVFERSISS